jgi:hypothetical protein
MPWIVVVVLNHADPVIYSWEICIRVATGIWEERPPLCPPAPRPSLRVADYPIVEVGRVSWDLEVIPKDNCIPPVAENLTAKQQDKCTNKQHFYF